MFRSVGYDACMLSSNHELFLAPWIFQNQVEILLCWFRRAQVRKFRKIPCPLHLGSHGYPRVGRWRRFPRPG
jgi:hypothetical protein